MMKRREVKTIHNSEFRTLIQKYLTEKSLLHKFIYYSNCSYVTDNNNKKVCELVVSRENIDLFLYGFLSSVAAQNIDRIIVLATNAIPFYLRIKRLILAFSPKTSVHLIYYSTHLSKDPYDKILSQFNMARNLSEKPLSDKTIENLSLEELNSLRLASLFPLERKRVAIYDNSIWTGKTIDGISMAIANCGASVELVGTAFALGDAAIKRANIATFAIKGNWDWHKDRPEFFVTTKEWKRNPARLGVKNRFSEVAYNTPTNSNLEPIPSLSSVDDIVSSSSYLSKFDTYTTNIPVNSNNSSIPVKFEIISVDLDGTLVCPSILINHELIKEIAGEKEGNKIFHEFVNDKSFPFNINCYQFFIDNNLSIEHCHSVLERIQHKIRYPLIEAFQEFIEVTGGSVLLHSRSPEIFLKAVQQKYGVFSKVIGSRFVDGKIKRLISGEKGEIEFNGTKIKTIPKHCIIEKEYSNFPWENTLWVADRSDVAERKMSGADLLIIHDNPMTVHSIFQLHAKHRGEKYQQLERESHWTFKVIYSPLTSFQFLLKAIFLQPYATAYLGGANDN